MNDWFVPGIGIFAGAIWGMIAGTLGSRRRSLQPVGQVLIAALGQIGCRGSSVGEGL